LGRGGGSGPKNRVSRATDAEILAKRDVGVTEERKEEKGEEKGQALSIANLRKLNSLLGMNRFVPF
jgi:hypothetical protein